MRKRRTVLRWLLLALVLLIVVFVGPVYLLLTGDFVGKHWTQTKTESAELSPRPVDHKDAVIQIFAARTWGARGAVSVHTWISVKPSNSMSYTVYQKIGWRLHHGNSALSVREDIPDRYWYGNRPHLIADLRGEHIDAVIEAVHKATMTYPYAHEYRLWPGPNSNTFVAWVARLVPELQVDLPPTAIGKDWLGPNRYFAPAPSGTGYMISFFGVLGITLGIEEGLEINVCGAHIGVDPLDLALRLPGFGIVSSNGYY